MMTGPGFALFYGGLVRTNKQGGRGVPQKRRGPGLPWNAHLGTTAKFWLSKHFPSFWWDDFQKQIPIPPFAKPAIARWRQGQLARIASLYTGRQDPPGV